MTTRRDVLTGLVALPIIPATGTAEAATVPARAVALAEPQPPQFLHEIDRQIAREIDTMERLLARMKDRLTVANDQNPMIRSGALFDMRCSFTALSLTVDFAREQIEAQRIDAEDAAERDTFRPWARYDYRAPEFECWPVGIDSLRAST